MLDLLFDSSTWLQFLLVGVLSVLMLGASFWFLGFLHRRSHSVPKLLPVAPAVIPVATLFALFMSFLAADVWNQERGASAAASQEVVALVRLQQLADPAGLNTPDAVLPLAAYRNAVSTQEWGSNFNHVASPDAAAALRQLRLLSVRLSRDGAPAPLVAQWLKTVDDLEDARLRRLVIGSDHTDDHQWMVVIVLAFFAYITIAAAHLDRPAAGRIAITLFALATHFAFWLLVMHTNPYGGGYTRVAMPAYLSEPQAVSP
jgi:hypothetical protein